MTKQELADEHYQAIRMLISRVENGHFAGDDVGFAIAMGKMMSHFENLDRLARDGYVPKEWERVNDYVDRVTNRQ